MQGGGRRFDPGTLHLNFSIAGELYDRFMGRYSVLLSPQLADLAGVRSGQRVLDVGCGPGALTSELAARAGRRVGRGRRSLGAVRRRRPGAQPRGRRPPRDGGGAPVRGRRVRCHPGAARRPLHGGSGRRADRARARHPARRGRRSLRLGSRRRAGTAQPALACRPRARPRRRGRIASRGRREGHLAELFEAAGLRELEETSLVADLEHPSFEDWWEPFTLGVGPAGAYVTGLDEERRAALRERSRSMLPAAPFVVTARAWAVRGLV